MIRGKTPIEWLALQPFIYKTLGKRRLHIFGVEKSSFYPAEEISQFKKNCWKEIEKFQQTETWLTRDEFLNTARSRINHGLNIYTLTQNEKLSFYGWVQPHCTESLFPYVNQRVKFQKGTATFFNAYVHPEFRGQGLYTRGIMHCARQTFFDDSIRYFVDAVENPNHAALKGNLKAGMEEQAILTTSYFFGKSSRMVEIKSRQCPMYFPDSKTP